MSIENKKNNNTETVKDLVKVKFNFSLSSPQYDPSMGLKKAKEEKSYIAFELQNHIDINTSANFYDAGKVYDVPLEFYNKFLGKTVETYNAFFGKFEGKSQKFAQRPKVPFMLKVDENGELLDPMQHKLDLYSTFEG